MRLLSLLALLTGFVAPPAGYRILVASETGITILPTP